MKKCKKCNGTGKINANIPISMIPDVGNTSFKDDCPDCGGMITYNNEDWKTKDPKMFEYDSNNNIVDVFVRKDPDCPFPFHEEDWWHQGLYFEEFRLYLNLFFERYDLPYRVTYYEEI